MCFNLLRPSPSVGSRQRIFRPQTTITALAFCAHWRAAGRCPSLKAKHTYREERRMAAQSNIYAGVAGYVGRPNETGAVAFSAGCGRRRLAARPDQSRDPNGLRAPCRPERGSSRHRGRRMAQHRSRRHLQARRLPRHRQADLVVPGRLEEPEEDLCRRSPVAIYRSENSGESWQRLPDPGIKDRATAPFAVRVMRMVQHPSGPTRSMRRLRSTASSVPPTAARRGPIAAPI